MRSYYARWADTGRPVYRLARAGHLKKRQRRFQVPSSLPFVRSSNRRQKRMCLCEPARKRCRTRPVSSGSPSPRPGKSLSANRIIGTEKLSAANPAGKVP